MKYLLFDAAAHTYMLAAVDITEVIPCVELVPLAAAPLGVCGYMQYRGDKVPVVDLCLWQAGNACHRLLSTRIIVTSCGAGEFRAPLGILAENVTDIIDLDPALVTGAAGAVSVSLADRPATAQLLAVETLLPPPAAAELYRKTELT